MEIRNKSRWRIKKLFFFLFIVAMIIGLGGVIMYLWNAILPDLFNVPNITYWQAMGLFVLSRLLFGSFRFGGKHGSCHRRPGFKDKLINMTDEEKKAFKTRWKKRCGTWKEED